MEELFGEKIGDQLRFEEKAGLVVIDILKEDGEVVGADLVAPGDLENGNDIPADQIAACLGINQDEIVVTNHQPTYASVGLSFTVIEIKNREVLARCEPNTSAIKELPFEHQKLHVYCKVNEPGIDIRCRMFAPTINIPEDAATGSANCALAAFLTDMKQEDGLHRYSIIQGEEMGRKSILQASVRKANGKLQEVRIGGKAVEMMSLPAQGASL